MAAWRLWPEQGLWNPCLAQLPPRLAGHELVRAAWAGIDPALAWDSHVHLVGTGDSGSGIVVHPDMESLLDPAQYARRLFFLNAGCAHDAAGSVDRAYLERLRNLAEGLHAAGGRGAKLLLFAFDRAHDAHGAVDWAHSALYVPDRYVREAVRAHPALFEWAASVHPYARDALERLRAARAEGARAVKWLPAAMNIDPASPRCDAFYDALRALEAGVRVVVAHCASLGQDRDEDRGPHGPYVESFALFARLMNETRFAGQLFGDLSAVTQRNRAGPALARLVEETAWHARLLNGSDYPLPGVMPLFSPDYLASLGLLAPSAAPVLTEIRAHNPLLFDFVLKRHLRSNGKRLPPGVFHTRRFFDPR